MKRRGEDGASKPFVEHLDDLRRVLLWSLGFAGAGMAVALPLAPLAVRALKHPLTAAGVDPATFLRILDVSGGVAVSLRIMLWGGLLLATPGIVWALAGFVFPGLTPRERRAVTAGLAGGAGLFAAGVALGYLVMLPLTLQVMFRTNAWLGIRCDFVVLPDYIGFVLKLLIAMGLAFELPVVVLLLGALGIVDSTRLRGKRRHAVVVLMCIAMVLTPPDVVSMLLMGVPLYVLFEACIWILLAMERRRLPMGD